MSESQFKFRRADEEPLYLDEETRSDDSLGAPAGLYLDREPTRAPRREGGRFPLIIASVIVFLIAAAVAAFALEPPAALRDWAASVTGRTVAPKPTPPPPVQAAEVPPAPVVPTPTEAAATAAAQEAAAAAAETPAAEPAPDVAEAPPEPSAKAEPPAKPKPAAKHKVAVKAKPPVKKISPPPKKKGLDLDALERSLN